jgi:putative ATP-binding cassette transporter
MHDEAVHLDRVALARCARAVRNFSASEVGLRAKAMAIGLVVFLIAMNGLNVVNSYVGRDFMTAIEQRSMRGFIAKAILYVIVFAFSTIVAVIYRFTEERLALLWREWLTRRLCTAYLGDRNYYALKSDTGIRNPDQRMAEDVRAFTATTLSFFLMILNGSFTIIAFAGVLWTISPLLFVVAVGYAATGSVLTYLVGRSLLWLNYRQSDREAAFRAELVHVRENAESIAVARREQRLAGRLAHRVDELTDNARKIIGVNRNLGFFTTGYNYLIQIIPALIVAPLFIRGEVEFGVITQSAMAFSHLIGAFSLVVTQFQSISSYAANIARLSSLAEAMDHPPRGESASIRVEESDGKLEFDHLTLRTPRQQRLLVNRLSLEIPRGGAVRVSSHEETPLVALFRATAGTWEAGEGRIVRPAGDRIMFLPESPYLPPGALRNTLVQGGIQRPVEDVDIVAALRALDAEALIVRAGSLDADRDWDDIYSLREQQVLSIARVLLCAPLFVFIDRITATLGPDDVERALTALRERDITCVVFGTVNGATDRFDAVLELLSSGAWVWKTETGGHRAA